jgi:uncharacterized lipoprotein NlpE involved in copper resistance
MAERRSAPTTPRAALAFVRRHGVVLMAARGPVPSLAEAIAGGPFRGSWWGHPLGKVMFRLFDAVADSRDVLVCRLVEGKITFVHRRVWPALVRLAPRFPKGSLAQVRQEHTGSGRHRNVVTPFPQWAPRDLLAKARRLDEEKAATILGPALGARRTAGRVRAAARIAGLLLAGLAIVFPGCGRAPSAPPTAPAVPATPVDAPDVPYATTYAGDIPCADCAGQRLTLTLFPDGGWRMRRTYKGAKGGQDRSAYEIGLREKPEGEKSRIVLRGAGDPVQLRFVAGDRLQLLDREAHVIDSRTNDLLSLQPTVDAISGPMPLRGLYTYMADAASFKECLTGRTLPIVPVAGSSALQSAYLAARHKPGAPVFVALTGVFVDRSPEPGAPVREHLIVTQYERVAPGESCAPGAAEPAGGTAKSSPARAGRKP